ncbi:DUF928 domain-containing protein [Tolypothrix sp. FACHB-123]|uniref:DUF928 domain-containing protein n=1 Tax=Tolypothrix sp. FACHB-123 TaxID=2692868 RepID=UPI001685DBC6|nr:DUF928 domain-containing protein [Tolypothrix sp. FACHB-123]MBD2354321.1 DUF928 domain-containing protein [Tolypothrix sp. FACHB-123]
MKSIANSVKLSVVLAIGFSSLLASQLPNWVDPVSAQIGSPVSLDTTIQYNPPAPPPEPPPGGRVLGGAKRGTCPALQPELTALVPFTKKSDLEVDVWALTTEAHPTFWFYVPLTKNPDFPAEFVLQDDAGKDIYKTAIALPEKPGVIGIPLPKNIDPLTLNKRYRWFFNIFCNPQQDSPPIFVEGVIQRVHLNQAIAQQIETAKPQQQSAIYAQNGIWYETLTTLAKLRLNNPEDRKLQTAWRNLITSIGLPDVAAEPIVSPPSSFN